MLARLRPREEWRGAGMSARVVGGNSGSAGVMMEVRSCVVEVASAADAQFHSLYGGKGEGASDVQTGLTASCWALMHVYD